MQGQAASPKGEPTVAPLGTPFPSSPPPPSRGGLNGCYCLSSAPNSHRADVLPKVRSKSRSSGCLSNRAPRFLTLVPSIAPPPLLPPKGKGEGKGEGKGKHHRQARFCLAFLVLYNLNKKSWWFSFVLEKNPDYDKTYADIVFCS